MKLQNRKTGEIGTLEVVAPRRGVADEAIVFDEIGGDVLGRASSIAELNEEWEDYEESKEYWYIDPEGTIICESDDEAPYDGYRKQIGNYFETKEEAEKAVEKLKAWKRLKDKGFRFDCWYGGSKDMSFSIPQEIIDRATAKDLDLLFGGEE